MRRRPLISTPPTSSPVPDQGGKNDTTTHRNQRASDYPGAHASASTPRKKNGESHGPDKGPRQRSARVLRGRGEVSPPAKQHAAAVIAADTGVLTTPGSIRCKSPTQAEDFAIALALAISDSRTVLSDSKPAIVNFATNNVHGTTARVCSTIARPEINVTVKWFPAYAGELDAGPNRNEEVDTEAHALASRGSQSTHSSEPQLPDAEDEEYSITTYGDVLQWYRTSRRLYPLPHRDLQRSEAATLRQLQVQAIWTPVWAKHVCPEVYTTDICQHCKKARATQRHLLWDCASPPGNQEGSMPNAISSKIVSREPGKPRDVVQHVLSILERQRPKAAPPRV
ncbi:hypothetical protein HPB52_002913 [Rhipicephalus sanguineus]|uniref:Tick transposon n=1 Tax=Rhipicephalus sanguineus TaxID=34632 RepID=A0A9D4Q6W9_RHISA|nr:hypothetical protein HPB52_002913 [Rhipicephalus sanguineus]